MRQLQEVSRADFLRSVGLYFLSDRIIMVRLRKSLLNVALHEAEERELPQGDNRQAISELTGWVAEDVKEIAFKAESEARERALRQALVSLLPHFNALHDAVYICVPPDQVVIQEIFFPLAAQDNLQEVIGYEIERQLPFKRDEIYYDFLLAGKKGEKLSVYVFAIPKKSLDVILAMLDSFGIKPMGAETTATALANYLAFSQSDRQGGLAVVAGHGDFWEMVGVKSGAGSWKQSPQLLFAHRLPASKWAQGMGKELLRQSLAQAPNVYRCGDLSTLNGMAESQLAQAEDLVTLSNPRLRAERTISKAEYLPAIGAALRGVREASLFTNLLRHESGDQGSRRALSAVNALLLGLFVLVLLAWGISYPIKDELRLRQLQKENEKLQPAVEALRREDDELQQLQKQVSYVAELDRRRGELISILDELSKIVPTTAYLSTLRYRAGVLEMQGSAENASALIPLLERSPLYENVGFNAPSNRGRDNRETFSLKADIEKPKSIPQANPNVPSKPPPKEAVKDPTREL
ncbi:MAG TPA: PilN domain-containing protein, partial [Terriglobales bacterium]|nr:PilN domain-containing protein [Terriglobales bacterium]